MKMLSSLFTIALLGICIGPTAANDPTTAPVNEQELEKTRVIEIGKPLLLHCDKFNDSIPITWSTEGERSQTYDNLSQHPLVFDSNNTLYFPTTTIDDLATYKCTSNGVFTKFHVITFSYSLLPKSITVLQGDKLTITCEAEGKGHPSIMWEKDEESISTAINSTRFHLSPNSKKTPNATLVIEVADYVDRGEYTCIIQSHTIEIKTSTFVRVKDMYAALWPFLGIVAEVIVLCLIIFFYERRRVKAEFDESDTDQGPEQKNPSDQMKDVRHRK